MAKKKFYVVWSGRKTGIFTSWDECNEQIFGFSKPIYKSFPTKELAEIAFSKQSSEFIGKHEFQSDLPEEKLKLIGEPIKESISVDGAWNTSTGDVEYQGVYTKNKELIFRVGPFADGTNNIVEFLGIVHALAHCKKNNITLPIYSDSKNAISWVKYKNARTKLEKTDRNQKLFEVLERAEKWLQENDYPNKILKWETRAWGENPADFGRK
jgi:ribonuclease HI